MHALTALHQAFESVSTACMTGHTMNYDGPAAPCSSGLFSLILREALHVMLALTALSQVLEGASRGLTDYATPNVQ